MTPRTIFDAPPPRPASRAMTPYLADVAPKKIPSQAEEGEPEVGSDPPLARNVFGYLEPRKGIDAPGDFRSCQSCASFIPERAFHAATVGNRCHLLGSFPVEPHANCFRYRPWCDGKPVEATIEHHALACLNGARSSLTPWQVGYCSDKDHDHKCRSCRHVDRYAEPGEPSPSCEFFETLNRSLPKIFQVEQSVDLDGGCSAYAEPVPDESNPSGTEGQY